MKIDRDRLHILHIRDAVDRVAEYSEKLDYAEFARQEIMFDAIMMQIIVIGEAVNSLSAEFKESHPTMPWTQAVALRNRTAHGYFDINPKIVWEIIKQDLPELKKQIDKIADKL